MAEGRVIHTPKGSIYLTPEEDKLIPREQTHLLRGLVENPRNNSFPRMPIFINDNLETVMTRWAKMYPAEAQGMLAALKEVGMSEGEGLSKEKTMMALMSIPDMVYWGMIHLDPGFWKKSNKASFRKFRELFPKLCSKART